MEQTRSAGFNILKCAGNRQHHKQEVSMLYNCSSIAACKDRWRIPQGDPKGERAREGQGRGNRETDRETHKDKDKGTQKSRQREEERENEREAGRHVENEWRH